MKGIGTKLYNFGKGFLFILQLNRIFLSAFACHYHINSTRRMEEIWFISVQKRKTKFWQQQENSWVHYILYSRNFPFGNSILFFFVSFVECCVFSIFHTQIQMLCVKCDTLTTSHTDMVVSVTVFKYSKRKIAFCKKDFRFFFVWRIFALMRILKKMWSKWLVWLDNAIRFDSNLYPHSLPL